MSERKALVLVIHRSTRTERPEAHGRPIWVYAVPDSNHADIWGEIGRDGDVHPGTGFDADPGHVVEV